MGLRLAPSVAARERRLERLLAERGLARDDARLASLVEDALLVGSLELAGLSVSWESARAARGAPAEPQELAALRRGRAAVPRESPVTAEAIRAWHACLAGPVGFRAGKSGDRWAGAPAELIEDRLAELALWLAAEGGSALGPAARSALALARIVEIRPFDDGNGRVARLAAAHLMAQAGLAPPILVKGDAPRLEAALAAAHRLETGPLVALVDEASARALAVMTQALERGLV
jgi:Fic/DOC family protein